MDLSLYHRFVSFTFKKALQQYSMVAHAHKPGTLRAEAGGSQIQAQPQELSETLFQKKKQRGATCNSLQRPWIQSPITTPHHWHVAVSFFPEMIK